MNIKITLHSLFLLFLLQSCNFKPIESYTKQSIKQLKLNEKYFQTSDGYRIAYSDNEVKDKPVIVFMHGYMMSRYNFFPLVKKFKKGEFRYILLDIPGFGKSSKDPNGDYKITSQAKRINELINNLNLTEVHLVGTSMGGRFQLQ